MTTFQVQCWPNGKWDGKDYQRVEAQTAQEAAEKLCGGPLIERGSNYKIRARVRILGDIRTTGYIFYEP